MIQQDVSTQIHRPVEEVFAFLVDHHNLTKWQSDLVESEQLTQGLLTIGTAFREVRRQGKRLVEIRSEVTDYQPNQQFSLQTTKEPHVTVRYTFERDESGTQLRYKFVLITQGWMRLIEPLIASAIKKQSVSDLLHLKSILESELPQGMPVTRMH